MRNYVHTSASAVARPTPGRVFEARGSASVAPSGTRGQRTQLFHFLFVLTPRDTLLVLVFPTAASGSVNVGKGCRGGHPGGGPGIKKKQKGDERPH